MSSSRNDYQPPRPLHATGVPPPLPTCSNSNSNSNRTLRCQDYASRPEVTRPAAPSAVQGTRGDLREDFTKQNFTSRQTMTTAAETSNSRFSHNDLLDSHFPCNRQQQQQHTRQDWHRRAEENAAFVQMLEEESFMLQAGGRRPGNQDKERDVVSDHHGNLHHYQQDEVYRDRYHRSFNPDLHHQQQRHYSRPYQLDQQNNRPIPRELSIAQERPMMHPSLSSARRPPALQEDIPSRSLHSFSKPSFVPPLNPLLERAQPEYPLDLSWEETRRKTSEEDRRHPAQLKLLQRQRKNRSLSPSALGSNRLRCDRNDHDRALIERMQDMQLRAMAEQQQFRFSNDDYVDRNGGYIRSSFREKDDNYHWRKESDHDNFNDRGVDRGIQNNEIAFRPPSDRRLENQAFRPHPGRPLEEEYPHPSYNHRQPSQYDISDMEALRLIPPIEFIEFPSDWQGLEIEETHDDDILERDHDFPRRPQNQQHRIVNNPSPYKSTSWVSRETNVDSILPPGAGRKMTIEVSPGVSMLFRGSEETWKAVKENRICETECLGCDIPLYCVEDAELVVCPDCQTLSPVQNDNPDGANNDARCDRVGGLGLGFKEEALLQWHATM